MIDKIIIFTYLTLILFIGIYNRNTGGGFRGFATIDSKIKSSKLILVATIFTSSVGGGTCFGISEKIFLGNFAYAFGLLFMVVVDILIAFFLVPKISIHYGAQSVGDIMEKYYGGVGRIISGFASTIVSAGFVAAQINVSGHIFRHILGIEHLYGVILSYIIIIIYTTIGGLKSILFTNLLQFFLMILTLPTLAIIGINQIGVNALIQNSKELLATDTNLLKGTIVMGLGYSVMNLYPSLIQRSLINPKASETSSAIYLKSIVYIVFLIFISLNGVISNILIPYSESSLALPSLIQEIIPAGLQGFIILGFLSAVMSTADADLHITSVSLTKDILMPIFNISSNAKMLIYARIANIFIGFFTIILALKFKSVLDLVIYVTGFWGPIILIPLIFALYNIVVSKSCFVISSISGLTAFLIWEWCFQEYFYLKGVFIGTFISFIVFVSFVFYKHLAIQLTR